MIGPAIPEGLLKKKQANDNEIVISFSDDEEEEQVGPQMPSSSSVNIGPQIPAHLLQKKLNKDEIHMPDNEQEQPVNIGPSIPEHLLRQKKTETKEPEPSVGPYIPDHILQQKRKNADEIPISDNDQDDMTGPHNTSEPVAGPQIPSHLMKKEDEVNPDDFAPALPPDLLEKRQQKTTQPTGRRRRPVGPTFPTGPMPVPEEDEYMVGPALPKNYNPEEEAKYSAIHAIEERAREAREAMEKVVKS